MYTLNKRNLKKDQKAKAYLDKTKKALEDPNLQTVEKNAKDIRSDLIMQIFKEEEDEHEQPKNFSLAQINIRVKAREQVD